MSKTIPQLPSAAALGGTEPIETVQAGVSVKTTAQAIADLGGGASLTVSDGTTSVNDVTQINFTGATVSAAFAGIAEVLVTGPELVAGDGIEITDLGGNSTAITNLNTPIQGAWTPQLLIAGDPTGIVASDQFGFYNYDGTKVTLSGIVVLTDQGLTNGNVSIGNLPYQAGSTFEGVVWFINMQVIFTQMMICAINGGDNELQLLTGGAGALVPVTDADIQDNTELYFSITYMVDTGLGPSPSVVVTGDFVQPGYTYIDATPNSNGINNTATMYSYAGSGWWLNGNLTDLGVDFSGAETITTNNISAITGQILFSAKNETILTGMAFPGLAAVQDGINLTNLEALTSLDLSDLQWCGNSLVIAGCTAYENQIDLSSLVRAEDGVTIGDLTAMTDGPDLSALVSADGSVYFYGLSSITTPPIITSLSTAGGFLLNNCTVLATPPSFDALESLGASGLGIQAAAIATGILFPVLTLVSGNIIISSNSALEDAPDFSALLEHSGDAYFNANALTEAAVDALLVKWASLDGTGGTTSWDNKSFVIEGGTNAVPSATGLAAKATLEGRGNTVTVNV